MHSRYFLLRLYSFISDLERLTVKLMPLRHPTSTEYTIGGTPTNRGIVRRLNPMICLTICCTLLVLAIISALIIFTFLPIFSSTQGNQSEYQVQSDRLALIYNLPDRLSMSPMNWTYVIGEFESDKLSVLQNLLQGLLNEKKITKQTSVTILDAKIVRQRLASPNLLVVSPVALNSSNKTIINLTQPDIDTKVNSTNQFVILLMLRYALECSKRCQFNLKESIFAKTFHNLELPIDTFQALFINEFNQYANEFATNPPVSTALTPCIVNTPPSTVQSTAIMAKSYEAESSVNHLASSTIQACSVCSGEQMVSNIGFTNELIFQQITSQYGGPTVVIFYYTTDRVRFAEIMVNNRWLSTNVTFPIIPSYSTIALLPMTLNLCQGLNSIRIFNPNSYTPDFDRIVVY